MATALILTMDVNTVKHSKWNTKATALLLTMDVDGVRDRPLSFQRWVSDQTQDLLVVDVSGGHTHETAGDIHRSVWVLSRVCF